MGTELFAANLATTTVTSGGTDAPVSGTSETWTVASSAMFGAASAGVSQFHVADPNAPSEMIAVTAVSGTTWTVTRGAEGTTPVSHTGGFTVYQVTTAGFLGGLVPASQTFPLANDTYKTLYAWTVTGQTDDPLPAFALVAGSQTYSNSTETTQGPAFWLGYNAAWLSASTGSSAHGAIGVSSFADAGDSWNGASGHGLEFNVVFRPQNGAGGTSALQVVALDDNTNTCWTTLRCGTGHNNNGFNSGIAFSKSDGSVTYLAMGPGLSDQIYAYVPLVLNGPAALVVSNAAGAQQVIENAEAGQLCGWFFQQGSSNAWGLYESGSKYFVVEDYYAGGGFPLVIWSAAASSNAKTIWAEYPLIMQGVDLVAGNTALATTATKGFLYLPTCAGAPTGTPSGHTGTVPAVYDTTDSRLYIYEGSAWHYIAMTA